MNAVFGGSDQKTRLKSLRQSGCLKALLPENHQPHPDVVLVNTAGGLTGGDQLKQTFQLSGQASVSCTSQAAERIYRASSGTALIETRATLKQSSEFCWFPQETIVFDGAALNRSLTINLDAGSSCMILESFILGRSAMGERLTKINLSDKWTVYRNGKMILMESLKIRDPHALSNRALLDGATSFATIALIDEEAEGRLAEARSLLCSSASNVAASAWNGCLLVRMVSASSQELRQSIIHFLSGFCNKPLPKNWHL